VKNLSLHETITYLPAAHFWVIQAVEAPIFILLAALLATAGVAAVSDGVQREEHRGLSRGKERASKAKSGWAVPPTTPSYPSGASP
jgi:hypothetical protein